VKKIMAKTVITPFMY